MGFLITDGYDVWAKILKKNMCQSILELQKSEAEVWLNKSPQSEKERTKNTNI